MLGKKWRTRVVRIFPNEDAYLRLVSAILIEFSEGWEFGKTYLNMENTQDIITGKDP